MLITFEPWCNPNGSGGCAGGLARVTLPCPNVAWMRFFGNTTNPTACTAGSALWNYGLGTFVNQTDFVGTGVHEFGHVLNIADNPAAAGTNTVMQQVPIPSDRRHLYSFDQDCVDESVINTGRVVYHHWLGINYLGGFEYFGSHYWPTSRGQLSGGYQWKPSTGQLFYGLFSAGDPRVALSVHRVRLSRNVRHPEFPQCTVVRARDDRQHSRVLPRRGACLRA